jgi:hypothetical protein
MFMDPMMMMMIMSMASGMGGMGGNKGEFKSSFGQNQQGGINDIMEMLKGMKGNADITQNQGYQQGQQWLNDLFNDENFFKNFEAPLQRQFQEQTVPDLANGFAGMGSGGSMGSTAFRNQLGREGSNLSTNIAALRGGMQQQGVNQQLGYAQQPFQNMMSMYQQGLGQPINNAYQPPSAGPFGNILASLTGGLAQGYGNKMGQGMAM